MTPAQEACMVREVQWWLKQEVLAYERDVAEAAAANAVTEIEVNETP